MDRSGRLFGRNRDGENPKPFDPVRKRLEWLASAKVGEELLSRDFQKHLGYGITDVTIKGIEEGNLCVYKKDGIYYITNKDKASLEAKYGVKNLSAVDLDRVIDDLEQRPNFDKIKWDLPKIHAINTIEKTKEWFDEKGQQHHDPRERQEVLITDLESEVKKRTKRPSTGQPTKTWETVLPWPADVIELSRDEKDKQFDEKYKEFSSRQKDLSEQWRILGKILSKLAYNSGGNDELLKHYLQVHSNFKKNVLKNQQQLSAELITYHKEIVEICKKENKNLKNLVGKDIKEFNSLVDNQEVQKAIKEKNSQLDFELKEKQVQFGIEGDLYLPKQGGDIRIAKEKQDDHSEHGGEGDKPGERGDGTLNGLKSFISGMFKDKLKKLPGWDNVEVKIDVGSLNTFKDQKVIHIERADAIEIDGRELEKIYLSEEELAEAFKNGNIQWSLPELYVIKSDKVKNGDGLASQDDGLQVVLTDKQAKNPLATIKDFDGNKENLKHLVEQAYTKIHTKIKLEGKYTERWKLLQELQSGQKDEKQVLSRLKEVRNEEERLEKLLNNPKMVEKIRQDIEGWHQEQLQKDRKKSNELEEELEQFNRENVPSEGNNCFLYALAKALNGDIGDGGSETRANLNEQIKQVRDFLAEARIVEKGRMLDPSDMSGYAAISIMQHRGIFKNNFTSITVYKRDANNNLFKQILQPNTGSETGGYLWNLSPEEGDKPIYLYLDAATPELPHYNILRRK